MDAVRQRAFRIINAMPKPEVEKFVTMNIRYEKPEPKRKKVSREEGWQAFKRMREQVQAAGVPEMTLDEINELIAEVRKERHERKATAK